jgi:glycyl-tRNA synthetase (class II)
VDSLDDGQVTVRDRDAMTQERIGADQVTRYILEKLEAARP